MAQNGSVLNSPLVRLRFLEYAWALLLGVLALWVGLQTLRAMSDDAFIPLRCVRRALEGQGLTYNPHLSGEQPCTSPLNLLLTLSLAWALRVGGLSSEEATLGSAQAWYVMALVACTLAGGYLVKGRASPGGLLYGALAGVLVLLSASFYTAGLETPLLLALMFGGMGSLSGGRVTLAFILLALAVLARHDALVLYGLVAILVVWQAKPSERQKVAVRSLLPLLFLMGPWLVFSAYYYGTTIPTTLEAKMAQGRSVYWLEPYSSGMMRWLGEVYGGAGWLSGIVAGMGLCLFVWGGWRRGLVQGKKEFLGAGLLVFYSVLHFLVYEALGVPPYHWYYLPYYAVGAVVVAIGLRAGGEWFPRAFPVWVVLGLGLMGLSGYRLLSRLPLEEERWQAYEEVGRYLAEHPPRVAVGLMEIGIIGFYCPKVTVFDFGGIVTPEQRERLMQGEALGWMSELEGPDKVVIRGEKHPLEPDYSPFFPERFVWEKSFAPTKAFPRGLQVWRVKGW